MSMRKSEIVMVMLILFSFATGIYFYIRMPEKMASQWNVQDQVNGYTNKFWGLFLMPLISIGLLLLFFVIPRIDPLKANIDLFRKHYDRFVVITIAFLTYIYLLPFFLSIIPRGMLVS